MIAAKKDLILRELEAGTGAAIAVSVACKGRRSGLRIWFADLDDKHGPVAELHPFGLKGHVVIISFGSFSGEVISQIKQASIEDVQLARALVASINECVEVEVVGQELSTWSVMSGTFQMKAKIRDLDQPNEDAALIATCREVIVPMMAAMAELIGYDVIEAPSTDGHPRPEGAISLAVIHRRERNPRNRLLCIRIHGEKCVVCGLQPKKVYGDAGSIIEVHHLEPLSVLLEPRAYDPCTDLVPLCPNCHRALHSRWPIPFSIEELRGLMG